MDDCLRIREQLADYLDQESIAELCRTIDAHLKNCPDCRVEYDTLNKTILLYKRDRLIEMPPGLRMRLHEALAKVYRQEAPRNA